MLRNVKAVKAARGPSGFVLPSFVEAVKLCRGNVCQVASRNVKAVKLWEFRCVMSQSVTERQSHLL